MKNQEMELKEKKEVKKSEGTRPGPVFVPAVDIFEDAEKITILADMPGVAGKDIDIDLREDQLTINGRVQPVEGEKEVALYKEFEWGDYFRQFTLSDAIDQGKISARMEDGVLRLTLPKVERMKPQKITVSAG